MNKLYEFAYKYYCITESVKSYKTYYMILIFTSVLSVLLFFIFTFITIKQSVGGINVFKEPWIYNMFIFEIVVICHIKQFKKLKDTSIIDKINKISGKQVKSIDEAKITLFQMILKKNKSSFYHELKLFDEFIKLNNNYKIVEFPNWDHVKKFLYDSNATNRIVTLIVFVFAIINTIFIKCNDFEIIFNAFKFVFSIQFIYYIMTTLPVLIGFYFAAGSLFNAFFNSFEFFMSKKIENKKVNDLFLRRFLSDLAKYALIK